MDLDKQFSNLLSKTIEVSKNAANFTKKQIDGLGSKGVVGIEIMQTNAEIEKCRKDIVDLVLDLYFEKDRKNISLTKGDMLSLLEKYNELTERMNLKKEELKQK